MSKYMEAAATIMDAADLENGLTSEEAGAIWQAIFEFMAMWNGDHELVSVHAKAPAAEVTAQILMEISPLAEKVRFKPYWMAVGEFMGPDYVPSISHAVGFMKKISEF